LKSFFYFFSIITTMLTIGRLKAMPQALTCVEHAEKKEDSLRPVEEDVLASTPKSDDFIELEEFGSSDTPQDKM